MPDIHLWIGPVVTPKDRDKVLDALSRLQRGDHLTISLEAADAHQAEPIIELLEDWGLDYQSRGDGDGQTYHIVASKPQEEGD
ncbi:MAG: hypothetical protein IMW96_05505 [Thermoanaerobacteraceae bacterium]|uniref:hypothetical protein n=1 Tax=Thermanaeromonas sp. C210 TaxID=2731925 RepID=UPI00155BE027|nr:hypothetical protein [Thermanaeromonas sp. C210]MBE3581077.1 hypothetical protein [Thermoanaerobacteraceae bacterium]GFN22661.1 hypothetical protein TAMC210_09770 [Thermanaeromonas sp. C210]